MTLAFNHATLPDCFLYKKDKKKEKDISIKEVLKITGCNINLTEAYEYIGKNLMLKEI